MKPIKIKSFGYYQVYAFAINENRWNWEIAIYVEPEPNSGQISYAHIKSGLPCDSQIDAVATGRNVAKALNLKKRVA